MENLSQDFSDLFDFLLNDHFVKEEEIFKPLLQASFLDHGGPRCTHFMAIFLNEDTFRRRVLLMAPYVSEKEILDTIKTFPVWITENSPLKIPLEEHNWVIVFKKSILMGLKDLDQDSESKKWAYVDMLIEAFTQFLGHHREKEDTCLFELIKANKDKIIL